MENEFRSYQEKLDSDFKEIKKDLKKKNPKWTKDQIVEEAREIMISRKPIESFIKLLYPEILSDKQNKPKICPTHENKEDNEI